MATVTISRRGVEKYKGIIVLPLKEYKKLLARAAQAVPTYYLKGRTAERLDRLVEEGLKEYRKGKTKKIKSLSDLD